VWIVIEEVQKENFIINAQFDVMKTRKNVKIASEDNTDYLVDKNNK